jgi:hypothetical protein
MDNAMGVDPTQPRRELELKDEDKLRQLLVDVQRMKVIAAGSRNEFESMNCNALIVRMALDFEFEWHTEN